MKRTYTISLVVLGIVLLLVAGTFHQPLNATKARNNLRRTTTLRDGPLIVSFTTVVLGGFRGLIADLLWLRSSILQEQGKFFELVQLAEWITTLEPHFPNVWAFHAWNLAYNISVLFDDPADRWRWVRHGIHLLRDRGIEYNPHEAQLYRELGWLFQHKLGADYDQAHLYYKRSWASEIDRLLPGGFLDYTNLFADTTHSQQLRDTLRNNYKLDPTILKQVDEAYGPFDWRLPYAHAVYWAYRGLPYAHGYEHLALRRMIYQSMAAAFRQGKLIWQPDRNVFMLVPDIRILPKVIDAFETAMREFPNAETIREAFPHFLSDAIVLSYTLNRPELAQQLLDRLQREYEGPWDGLDLDTFVLNAIQRWEDAANTEEILHAIHTAAYQSQWWKLAGDAEQAEGYARLARKLWDKYTDEGKAPAEWLERLGLPPLDEIMRLAEQQAMADWNLQSSQPPSSGALAQPQ